MGLVVGFFEALGGDVGVDLGRNEVGVAEKFLDAAEVGAGVEHMGGVAVAEFVGCEVRIEAGGGEMALKAELDEARIHGVGLVRVREENGHGGRGRLFEGAPVGFNGLERGCADGDEAFFLSFAADADDLLVPVDVLGLEAAEFAYAQAAGVNDFEDGGVAVSSGSRGRWPHPAR